MTILFTNLKFIIPSLFFISGTAGLIYEIIWSEMLVNLLGSSTIAVTVIISAFMGGLAIGSWTIGNLADTWNDRKIANVYIFIEIAIGVYALSLSYLINDVETFYLLIYNYFNPQYIFSIFIKFIIGFLVLIIPTFLMGTTLPLITRYLSRNWENYSKNVSLLYGLNTLGAIIGTLFAGFYLLEKFGISGASIFSASINFLVALLFFFFRKTLPSLPSRTFQKKQSHKVKESKNNDLILIILTSYTISGMASMFYQISWTRALSLILGTSTYAFTIILATFLLGISLGSILFRFIPTKFPKIYLYIITQLIIIVSIFSTTIYFDELPLYYLQIRDYFFVDWYDLHYIRFFLASIIILIPTIAMGILFPIVCDLISLNNKNFSQIVGKTYALNSIGAMTGAILAGIFVIPVIGLQYTIYVGIFLNILATIIVFLESNLFAKNIKFIFTTSICIFYLFSIVNINNWSPKVMSSGVSTYADNYFKVSNKYKELEKQYSDNKENLTNMEVWKTAMLNYDLLYYKDGLVDSIAVMKNSKGVISLLVNGKVDASAKGQKDIITQIMIGQLPLLFHPKPENVFLVGYASGITAGAILSHPIKKLDAAEISPSIIEASKFFNEFNNNPIDDSRMNLKIADAKHTLMVSKENYDVIVSQPSNPWIKGQSSLFSYEWYKIVKKHLTNDGLFMQWLPAYNISEENLKIIINTLNKVFPNISLWSSTSSGDLILLASNNKDFKISKDEVIKRINYPNVKKQLEQIDLYTNKIIEKLFLKDSIEINAYLGNNQNSLRINSDDMLITEFTAPIDMTNKNNVNLFSVKTNLNYNLNALQRVLNE